MLLLFNMCIAGPEQNAGIKARSFGDSFGEQHAAAQGSAGCLHQYESWLGDST